MADYEKMYYKMVDGAERAIAAINEQNFGQAKKILISAEQVAEEIYISSPEPAAEKEE